MSVFVRVMLGGALITTIAGCHSYQPYSYGGGYPAYQQGPYSPQPISAAPYGGAPYGQGAIAPQPWVGSNPYGGTGYSGGPTATLNNDPEAVAPSSLGASATAVAPRPRTIPDASQPNAPPPGQDRPVPPPRDINRANNGLLQDDADTIRGPNAPPPGGNAPPPSADAAPPYDTLTNEGAAARFGDESINITRSPAVQPASVEHEDAPTSTYLTQDGPSPFDYDRTGYAWLRGLARYDSEQDLWYVQYSSDTFDDSYGGKLPLMRDPRLDSLLSGDIVFVRGRINLNARDNTILRRPQYQARDIHRLRPKARLRNAAGQ